MLKFVVMAVFVCGFWFTADALWPDSGGQLYWGLWLLSLACGWCVLRIEALHE